MIRPRLATLALLAVAIPALAAPPEAKPARSLHWKTVMTGGMLTGEGLKTETWVKGDFIRMVLDLPGAKQTFVIREGLIYMTAPGIAVKTNPEEKRQIGPRPVDYVIDLDTRLKSGSKAGVEMVDGEDCDKWAVTTANGTSATIWVSPSLHFARRVAVPTDEGEIVMHNTDIDVKAKLDEQLFKPERADYVDMTRKGGEDTPVQVQ